MNNGFPTYLVYVVIFFVVFFGALGVFLYYSNASLKKTSLPSSTYVPTQRQTTEKSEDSTPAKDVKLTVSSPEDKYLTSSEIVKLAGAATPGTYISVTGGKEDVISDVKEDGSFVFDVAVDEGEHVLTVTAHDLSGQSVSKNVTVTFAREELLK